MPSLLSTVSRLQSGYSLALLISSRSYILVRKRVLSLVLSAMCTSACSTVFPRESWRRRSAFLCGFSVR